jgi:hypothetical protein
MKRIVIFTPGQKIGSCVFVKEIKPIPLPNGKHIRVGRFKCECGKIFTAKIYAVRSGNKSTCGCRINSKAGRWIKHGYYVTNPAEFMIWRGMIMRCHNPKDSAYYYYGAKGISVCDRWRYSFENFLADMGPRPSKMHSLDRHPNRLGNYEPGNVRWATTKEQNRNSSRNIFIEYNGKTQCLKDWCDELGHVYHVVSQRIKRLGWAVDRAFSTPPNQKVVKICYFCGKEFEVQHKKEQSIIACSNNCRSAINRRRAAAIKLRQK